MIDVPEGEEEKERGRNVAYLSLFYLRTSLSLSLLRLCRPSPLLSFCDVCGSVGTHASSTAYVRDDEIRFGEHELLHRDAAKLLELSAHSVEKLRYRLTLLNLKLTCQRHG